ncbi:MAG: primosomal protein N' [Rhodospirillales bacterium]|nr:primosomal protein N' [Rhodospirillales bacterium]
MTLNNSDVPETVPVLLPLALPGAFDYRVMGQTPKPGSFVRVPLGKRERIGVVWDAREGDPEKDAKPINAARLKDVIEILDAPPLPDVMRRFIDWVANYSVAAPGAVLRMAMSAPKALSPEKGVTAYARSMGWSQPDGFRLTPARTRVLNLLSDGPDGAPRTLADIRAETGASAQVIKGLAIAGAVVSADLPPPPPFALPDPDQVGLQLSSDQEQAAGVLRERVLADAFSVTLLDGVTGSGKTEVYFEAIGQALKQGHQALVLLPEISLSNQWLDRFETRFGVAPALWHSELSPATRRKTWRAVAEGTAKVVVGARSALFLPFPDLGLVVVDEEHDGSYKQEDGVFYNARDMAVVRANLGSIPVVLASATPSLETVVNVERDRYHVLALPERIGDAVLPEVALIDLREDRPASGHFLAPALVEAIGETVAAVEQVLLFLNRRGYAPLTLCRACGYRVQCPNCSAWLVEHRSNARLSCHHCGHAPRLPEICPKCEAEESFVACGPGVERIAEEVANLFPTARHRIMASDTMTGASAMDEMISLITTGGVDILIGTQVIAKGHHFPHLTLVGVVDADLGLSGGDLRASERTHQLLTQVAGRAGRGSKPGRVLIQTHMPEHDVMAALVEGDRAAFLAAEKAEREYAHMPPFGRLAAVIISGPIEKEVDGTARALGRGRPKVDGVEILGPAPAALALLRGRHRRRFLVKASRNTVLQAVLKAWIGAVRPGKGVRIQVDIDPMSFL